MKHFIAALLACAMLLSTAVLLPSCGEEKPEQPANAVIVKDGTANYTVVRSKDVARGSDLLSAATNLKNKLKLASGAEVNSSTDSASTATQEILIGATDREESKQVLSELAINEGIIKVVGDKVVIAGTSDTTTILAINHFIDNYIPSGATTIELPADLSVKVYYDASTSAIHGRSYESMGDVILKAYTRDHYKDGNIPGTWTWDAAEILEAYIDAYEQTGNEQYLEYIEGIANYKFSANNARVDWCANNAYNDDIAWICIGFARIYHLTGEKKYLNLSKKNFDTMWKRAYSPDVLGGGLWWKDDQKDTKNSCIQCPASIAACLIAKGTGDDSYYEKAKELMEWEFETLFNPETGEVYDAKRTNGDFNYWCSTYNQGTFVGACILLHEKYGDQKYLDYAAKAVEYGMTELDNVNGVLNGESSGNDLPGFKGILTRWFYRYAVYTNDLDVLQWLQHNADTAYSNRNSKNKIWTHWAEKTSNNTSNYGPWGLSAAMALMFNCEQWWENPETPAS